MGRCLAEGVAHLCHLSPVTPAQVPCLPVGLRPLRWVAFLILCSIPGGGWVGGRKRMQSWMQRDASTWMQSWMQRDIAMWMQSWCCGMKGAGDDARPSKGLMVINTSC